MKKWGFTNPVLIDESGGIIAGHGRVMAAKKLGLTEVPVMVAKGWSEAQNKAYVIADNKLALNSGWDDAMLKVELEDLQDLGFDLDMTGFSADELALILVDDEDDGMSAGGLTDEDAAPEVPVTPVSKLGDLWILGNHRLLCGDSTSEEQIKKLMENKNADMWLTYPPYNVDMTAKNEMLQKAGKARKDAATFGLQNDAMDDSSFREFLVNCYKAANSSLKEGGVFYIWHADSEGYNFRGAALDIGWKVRQCLIWAKSVFAIGRSDYHWKHEPCLYGWKNGAAHTWESDRCQSTLLQFNKPSKSGEHPTMKPVMLFEYQIANNTKKGEIILDSFGGSGTTTIACEKLGRKSRLMELDPKYVDVIVTRWEQFSGKKAELEATGQSFEDVKAERLGR